MIYSSNKKNTGTAIIIGMIAVLIISGFIITYSQVSLSHARNNESFADHQQARYASISGLNRASAILGNAGSDDTNVPMAIGETKYIQGTTGGATYIVKITRRKSVDLSSAQMSNIIEEFTAADFTIKDCEVIPHSDYTATVKFIGAEFGTAKKDFPVTARVRIGSQSFEPFGAFDSPEGNLNDGGGPREFVMNGTKALESITVEGRSFNGRGETIMTIDPSTNGTNSLVLRNGDKPPYFNPIHNQAPISSVLADYIDAETGTIKLKENEVIYLMELGTKNVEGKAYDMQDLVMVVSFSKWHDLSDPDCPYFDHSHNNGGNNSETPTVINSSYGVFEVVSTGFLGDLDSNEAVSTTIAAVSHELNDASDVVAKIKSKTDGNDSEAEKANIQSALNGDYK